MKLVSLFVNVTDKNGAIVGSLTQDDFKIFEDGRPQKIAVFERESEIPLEPDPWLSIPAPAPIRDRIIEGAAA